MGKGGRQFMSESEEANGSDADLRDQLKSMESKLRLQFPVTTSADGIATSRICLAGRGIRAGLTKNIKFADLIVPRSFTSCGVSRAFLFAMHSVGSQVRSFEARQVAASGADAKPGKAVSQRAETAF